jgi:two-component system, response regulator PdtaR
LCRELKPDLVLMDIGLPGMDGLEAARVMNLERPLPVVLVTGHAGRRFQERARQALVYSYLVKPVEAEVLGPAIELAAQTFARERDLERRVTDLRQALNPRKLLERARGLLMDRHRLTEPQAQARLEREAEAWGLDLPGAAQALLDGGQPPGRPAPLR